MDSREKRKRRHRVRGRTLRKVRMTMAVAGAVMLVIGAGMLIWGGLHGVTRLCWVGLIYMILAVAVLAVRQAMVAIAAAREDRGEDAARTDGGIGAAAGPGRVDVARGIGP